MILILAPLHLYQLIGDLKERSFPFFISLKHIHIVHTHTHTYYFVAHVTNTLITHRFSRRNIVCYSLCKIIAYDAYERIYIYLYIILFFFTRRAPYTRVVLPVFSLPVRLVSPSLFLSSTRESPPRALSLISIFAKSPRNGFRSSE